MPEITNLKRRKGLVWLMVSEVSVCGRLACCFGPVVRQNITVGNTCRESCSPMVGRTKAKRQEWARVLHLLHRHTPVTQRPSTRPHLLKAPLPPSNTALGSKSLTHGLLRDTSEPNYGNLSVPTAVARERHIASGVMWVGGCLSGKGAPSSRQTPWLMCLLWGKLRWLCCWIG
jgi:hypothetical protein